MKLLHTLLIFVSLGLSACGADAQPTASPSPMTSPPSLTPSPVSTATPSVTPSLSPTPTLPDTPTVTPTPTATALPPKVVLISIDGLRPDAVLQAEAPTLLRLAQTGAYSWQAQTIFPPVTLPSHASMLCGCPVEAHGLTWNDYRPREGTIQVPTIFSVARAAGLRTVLVAGKEKFQHFNSPGAVEVFVFAVNGDQDVADQAIAQVASGFDLMFVHFPNMDYFGHLSGWMSNRYLGALTRTDEAVGRLLAALPEQTTVIVTSDHGGHGLGHGSNIPEDMTIPWIVNGPGVVSNHEIATPITTLDSAATVLYVLGLEAPAEMTGVPVGEAFGVQE